MKIIVEKGDSISSIAKALNTTPEKIKRLNKITTNILSIGDELTIEEDKGIEKIGNDYYHKTQPEQNQIFQRKINEIIDYLMENKQ